MRREIPFQRRARGNFSHGFVRSGARPPVKAGSPVKGPVGSSTVCRPCPPPLNASASFTVPLLANRFLFRLLDHVLGELSIDFETRLRTARGLAGNAGFSKIVITSRGMIDVSIRTIFIPSEPT